MVRQLLNCVVVTIKVYNQDLVFAVTSRVLPFLLNRSCYVQHIMFVTARLFAYSLCVLSRSTEQVYFDSSHTKCLASVPIVESVSVIKKVELAM